MPNDSKPSTLSGQEIDRLKERLQQEVELREKYEECLLRVFKATDPPVESTGSLARLRVAAIRTVVKTCLGPLVSTKTPSSTPA